MFNNNYYLDLDPETSKRGSRYNHAALLNQSIELFNRARRDAAMMKIKGFLLRCNQGLLDINNIPAHHIRTRSYCGYRPVSIDKICGTLGRTHDFDSSFHPLQDRIRERWVNIAMARRQNIILEPVDLIQVGEYYFVKDGHHRISVAHALGETVIDAVVTHWEAAEPMPRELKSFMLNVRLTA